MSKKRTVSRKARTKRRLKSTAHKRTRRPVTPRKPIRYRVDAKPRRQVKQRNPLPSSVHPARAFPLIHHRLHLSFDAPLDSAAPTDAPVPIAHYGSTNHFDLAYDASLGSFGESISKYFQSACEYDLQRTANLFGLKWDAMHFIVTTMAGNGGAWHPDPCSNSNIFVGAQTALLPGGHPNYLFLRSMVLSEIVEVLGSTFRWDCGVSNGEGLSRVISDFLVPAQRPQNFLSAKFWLDPPSSREDFVSNTFRGDDEHPGDRDYPSIGCSVLFLNWMHFQVGIPWEEIVDHGAATLKETYDALVRGGGDAFAVFSDFINRNEGVVNARAAVADNVFPI